MNKFLYTFLILFSFVSLKSQLISYKLQESFTKSELQSFLDNSGFQLPLLPQYEVDIYQIFYMTPYKHIDSLIETSGIVAIPKNVPCGSSLIAYGHGTFSNRNESASFNAPERPINFLFAGFGGVVSVMPDILGLGEGKGDSSILTHPYVNTFHIGHTIINSMRAARELSDILSFPLNGDVILTGYSQGGHTTMAANKLIQENYSNEFDIKVSIPMSGPYDLNKTMVDVMLSDDEFSVPGYLPYLLLGYHSIYDTLQSEFPTVSDMFKSPYDTLLPPLYYSKTTSIGSINPLCDPVPKNMLIDSVLQKFQNDMNHPLRYVLNENDLMGWAPQNQVRVHYCTEDEEVNYLNGVRADSAWRANGAPDVIAFNNGPFNHGGCVEPSITSTAIYLLSITSSNCTSIDELGGMQFKLFPNPTKGIIHIESEMNSAYIKVMDLNGKLVFQKAVNRSTKILDISHFNNGVYFMEISDEKGNNSLRKIIKE